MPVQYYKESVELTKQQFDEISPTASETDTETRGNHRSRHDLTAPAEHLTW